MEAFQILNSDVRKYLRLRKVFRVFEAFASLLVIIVSLVSGEDFLSILGYIVAVLIFPELYLAIQRSIIKYGIRYVSNILKEHIEFCSVIMSKYEDLHSDIVSQDLNSISEKGQEIIHNEKMNTGLVSDGVKKTEDEINETKKMIEKLKRIKRLVKY